MKILHVVPTYLPAVRYGGPIVAVHGLCRALVQRGHEVQVFTTNVDGNGTLDVPTGSPMDLDGVGVHYFESSFPRLYWSSAMRRAFRREVSAFDIVHTHAVYLWPGIAAARAARAADVPYVVAPRGMLVPELIRRRNRFLKQTWLHLLERRALAGAAGIHFTSKLEWEDALRVGVPLPSPFVVANGIDLVPRPAVTREQQTLLFLGRVNWKKGIDRVLEALPAHPDLRFIIAGNDEEGLTPRLLEQARSLGVADRVEVKGPVYGDAKFELLARATLFVLLSRSENFGNTVLEALMMETPVVLSSEVGLSRDVLNAGAGIVGMENLGALLGDPERRRVMGAKGRAMVEAQFAWPRVAEEMESAYKRILQA